MNYQFRLRCLQCGHDVQHRTAGPTNGSMTRAIGDCTNCGLEHRITVCLQTVDHSANPDYRPRTPAHLVVHGTPTMYRRGCRCDHCKAAHTDDVKQRRRVLI